MNKLKENAKKSLKGNYTSLVLVTLIFIILESLCIIIGHLINTEWISLPLIIIVDSLICFGFIDMVVKTSNNEKTKISHLLSKTDLFIKYICVSILGGLIIALLTLLASIAFKSLVMVISTLGEINAFIGAVLIIFGILLTTIIIMSIIYLGISFSQTLFIINDEEKLPASKALSKSFEMMEGYMLEYFILIISFIGWIILGIFTLGILYLWLIPYIAVSLANFYKQVKQEYEEIKGNIEPEEMFNNNDNKEIEFL